MRIKRAAERTLVAAGAPRLLHRRVRGTTVVLAYHNVVPDGMAGCGDRSLHLALSSFQDQLDVLAETHDIVPLADALAGAPGSRPRAVITFDDAYRGAVTLAADELAVRGLPATIFVAPGYVPNGSYWWDANVEAVPEPVRERMLTEFGGRDGSIRDHLGLTEDESAKLPEWCRVATERELADALADHTRLTLGSHSWSHPNLTRLDESELAFELTASLDWLRARYSQTVPWLACPYGLTNVRVSAAAAGAGYDGVLRVGGGRVRAGTDPYDVPRLNVPAGLSRNGFALRVGGVIGP